MNRKTRIGCIAAALAACAWSSAPASGQSLALSYKLDARPDTAQQTPAAAMNRCAGFNWMASIGACGRELLTRITPARTADGVYANGAAIEAVEVAGFPDLPALGVPPPEPRTRAAGVRDTLIGSSRVADLMFRLGSKYRLRGAEEGGWDAHKFVDTNFETHLQNNGHKALGLELLVPFH